MRDSGIEHGEHVASRAQHGDPLAPWREFPETGYGLHCEQLRGQPCTAEVTAFDIGAAR